MGSVDGEAQKWSSAALKYNAHCDLDHSQGEPSRIGQPLRLYRLAVSEGRFSQEGKHMFSKTPFSLSAFAIAVAMNFWSSAPAVSGKSNPHADSARYRPIENISYDFGSKSMSGYFVRQGPVCRVSLMVIEREDPDQPSHVTATRVRLTMDPGQVAGLDSEEGDSLNFTCGKDAAEVIVDRGERSELIAQQGLAASKTVVKVQAEQ